MTQPARNDEPLRGDDRIRAMLNHREPEGFSKGWELEIAGIVSRKWPIFWKRICTEFGKIDGRVWKLPVRSEVPDFGAEVKHRNKAWEQYPTAWVSVRKVEAANALAFQIGIPTYWFQRCGFSGPTAIEYVRIDGLERMGLTTELDLHRKPVYNVPRTMFAPLSILPPELR